MPRDRKGFTLLELLISATIFTIVLLALYLVYETNHITFLRGEKKADLQQSARIGMDRMETEIRMIGYGVPTATTPLQIVPIRDATETSLSFLADLDNASTTLSAAANASTTSLAVVSAAGFKAGDVIYMTDGLRWEQLTVESEPKTTPVLGLTSAPAGTYAAGSMVTRPKTIRYSLVCDAPPCPPNPSRVKRDAGDGGGLQPLADQITLLAFVYYDSGGNKINMSEFPGRLKDIRRIAIALETSGASPGQDPQSYTLKSEVRPRNLGL